MTAVQPPARDLDPTAGLTAAVRRPPRRTPGFQLPSLAGGPKDRVRETAVHRKGGGQPAPGDDPAEAGGPPAPAMPAAPLADPPKPPIVAAALAEAGQAMAAGAGAGADDLAAPEAAAQAAALPLEAAAGASRQAAWKAGPAPEGSPARSNNADPAGRLERQVDPAGGEGGLAPVMQQASPASQAGDRSLPRAAAGPHAAGQAPDPGTFDAPRPQGNPARPAAVRRAGAAAPSAAQPSGGFRMEAGPAGGQPRLHGTPAQPATAAQLPEPQTPADVLVSRSGPGGLEVVIAAATPDLRDRFRAATDELHGELQRIGTEVDAIRVELRGEMGAEQNPGGHGAGDDAPAARGQPEGQPAEWNRGLSDWGLSDWGMTAGGMTDGGMTDGGLSSGGPSSGGEPDAAARNSGVDGGTGSGAASGEAAARADGADTDSPSGETDLDGDVSDRADREPGGGTDGRGPGGAADRDAMWIRVRLSAGAAGAPAASAPAAASGPRFDRYA